MYRFGKVGFTPLILQVTIWVVFIVLLKFTIQRQFDYEQIQTPRFDGQNCGYQQDHNKAITII